LNVNFFGYFGKFSFVNLVRLFDNLASFETAYGQIFGLFIFSDLATLAISSFVCSFRSLMLNHLSLWMPIIMTATKKGQKDYLS
jgi:hypothetical protein